ncbi:MAG: glycoside hydrolase family 3 C-terminal domain-containing protein, partial [Candidatus Omnitrophota bacterium]
SDDGSRLYLDGRQIINQWRDHGEETKTAKVRLEAGREYDLKVEFFESYGMASVKLGWDTREDLLEAAVEAARKSDIAIVFAGMSRRYEAEGFDRKTLDLPEGQDDLIKKIASANKNTIVVLNNGAPVIVEKWLDDVAALVEAWFPGQEGGDSVSEVLLGRYNPSGKLPMTFPIRWEDCSAYDTYPGRNGKAFYSEGIYVGYRYFDKQKKEVRFPFGYGLSYTTFEYSNLSIAPVSVARDDMNIEVSFDVKNTGRMEGAEIAQLYVSDPESGADRPPRELKGFRKVFLKPGETRKVVIKLDKRSLAFYSVSRKDWVAESGEFEVIVGSSSRDARLIGKFTLEPGRPI